MKRTPFTAGRGGAVPRRRSASCPTCRPSTRAGTSRPATVVVSRLACGTDAEVDAIVADYPLSIDADHRRRAVLLALLALRRRARAHLRAAQRPRPRGRRSASGCCCCCSAIAVALRRDLPARAVRASCARSGARCPAKGISAVYFAALGLGFMFFEITMIQRLVRFLGYPDLFADRHARVDPRLHRARRAR